MNHQSMMRLENGSSRFGVSSKVELHARKKNLGGQRGGGGPRDRQANHLPFAASVEETGPGEDPWRKMDAAKRTLEACVSLMMQAMNFKSIRDRYAPLHQSIEPGGNSRQDQYSIMFGRLTARGMSSEISQ